MNDIQSDVKCQIFFSSVYLRSLENFFFLKSRFIFYYSMCTLFNELLYLIDKKKKHMRIYFCIKNGNLTVKFIKLSYDLLN
jgi:hypothetical protein